MTNKKTLEKMIDNKFKEIESKVDKLELSDNDIENKVSLLLSEGKEVPEHLMFLYKQSKNLKETTNTGQI